MESANDRVFTPGLTILGQSPLINDDDGRRLPSASSTSCSRHHPAPFTSSISVDKRPTPITPSIIRPSTARPRPPTQDDPLPLILTVPPTIAHPEIGESNVDQLGVRASLYSMFPFASFLSPTPSFSLHRGVAGEGKSLLSVGVSHRSESEAMGDRDGQSLNTLDGFFHDCFLLSQSSDSLHPSEQDTDCGSYVSRLKRIYRS